MKKIVKNAIKICVFISLAILPFITVTQMIGLDTFLDSFENSEYYLCLQDKDNSLGSNTKNGEYIIIQKSSHPDFDVEKSDSIIYCKDSGDITCDTVYSISTIEALKRYYTTDKDEVSSQPIYEIQILGKIINIVDDNLWNSISISLWEASINSLNIRALVND